MRVDVYVEKLKNGDQSAFDIIYKETLPFVKVAIYTYIQNKNIIEDLIQDVYMKANKQIGNYKSNNFSAWIYTIAKNTALDYVRKKHEQITDNIYYKSDENITHPYIRYAINHLEEDEREVFLLKVLCGYTTKKISVSLGLDIYSVNKLYKRAKIKLKKSLEDIEDEIK